MENNRQENFPSFIPQQREINNGQSFDASNGQSFDASNGQSFDLNNFHRNEEGQLVLTTASLNLPFIEDEKIVQQPPASRRPPNARPPPNADPRHRSRTRVRDQVNTNS